jgi:carbamoyl-phosphate synthase small subunit
LLRVLISDFNSRPIKLVLEDGEVFDGFSFGAFVISPVIGEVVFNTGMVGYTEAMTDPSYSGQILCFTYPLIGNYGVPDYVSDDYGITLNFESNRIQAKGIIVNSVSRTPSHFESKRDISTWMNTENIPGIEGIDTRELTIHLRTKGVMMGAITASVAEGKRALERSSSYSSIDFCSLVSTRERRVYGNDRKGKIALIDCGVKLNIIRSLVSRGFQVIVYPYTSSFSDICGDAPAGIVLSNGPGDPKQCDSVIDLTKSAIDNSIPTLGICLGTQIIALSQGAETFKLKYGHRGQNKPCVDLRTGRCMVTSQNHGYSVDAQSLKGTKLVPWFVNADDHTIEGLLHETKPCLSVQFHPEGSPGPLDPSYVFDIFAEKIAKREA